jgi:hypothetical protein
MPIKAWNTLAVAASALPRDVNNTKRWYLNHDKLLEYRSHCHSSASKSRPCTHRRSIRHIIVTDEAVTRASSSTAFAERTCDVAMKKIHAHQSMNLRSLPTARPEPGRENNPVELLRSRW